MLLLPIIYDFLQADGQKKLLLNSDPFAPKRSILLAFVGIELGIKTNKNINNHETYDYGICKIKGLPVFDFLRNFEERWQKVANGMDITMLDLYQQR